MFYQLMGRVIIGHNLGPINKGRQSEASVETTLVVDANLLGG